MKIAEMDQRQFRTLPIHEKIRKLYTDGEFIVSIRYYRYKINLYLFAGYFVEVFYNHKEDRIEKIDLFDYGSTRLKFYADQIRLPVGFSG